MSKVTIKDKVILVTGTGKKKGIGRAIVLEAIKRDAKKIYTTARDLSQLEDLVSQYPGKIVPIKLDVTDKSQIQEVVEDTKDLQILVNNAGLVSSSGCLHNYDEEKARQEMEVNYFGPINLMNAFKENILQNGDCAFVNVNSIGGLYPSPMHVTYSAAKSALYSVTLAMRIEAKMYGIDLPIFGVYPGPIDTSMAEEIDVRKESPSFVANRIFDNMEHGILDITTDKLSDHFRDFLKRETVPIDEIKKVYFGN